MGWLLFKNQIISGDDSKKCHSYLTEIRHRTSFGLGLRRRTYKRVPLMQREDRGLMIKYYLVKSIESTVAESVDAEMMKKFDKNLLITPILKSLLTIMDVLLFKNQIISGDDSKKCHSYLTGIRPRASFGLG
ncbi:hypothetical protein H8356DRAFT_1358125 [Neocallimastix lanati (nom. inval.)]|nr:hypothetical protein H8356DRAFT_1358125 [Neocallimastix sp. JGI-2020a]